MLVDVDMGKAKEVMVEEEVLIVEEEL